MDTHFLFDESFPKATLNWKRPDIPSQFIILFDGGHFEVICGVMGGLELQHHLNRVQICGEINGKSTCRQLEMKELTNMEIYTVVREVYQPDFVHSYCRKWVEINVRFCDIFKTG